MANDKKGKLCGIFTFYPYPQGYTLDLMIRTPDSSRGLVEAAIVEGIGYFKNKGSKKLSLGFGGFMERKSLMDSHPIEQGLQLLYSNFNQLYNFKDLVKFKNKFKPAWEPRYLVYKNNFDLGKIISVLFQTYFRVPWWKKYFSYLNSKF